MAGRRHHRAARLFVPEDSVDVVVTGTCRDTAPAVLALDEQVSQLEEGDVDVAAARPCGAPLPGERWPYRR